MLDSNINRKELNLVEIQRYMKTVIWVREPIGSQPDNIRIVLPKRKNNVGCK